MEKRKVKINSERGASLVMALMMVSLLLTGCIALLTGASLNAANVTDAVAEQQAYNAAESGIQTAINVLRRNTAPNPLLDNTQPGNHPNNRIDFARAVRPETSNAPTDPSSEARLSRWINYNYTPSGATNPDRASITPGIYDPQTGSAFSVTVRDPDNAAQIISLTTSASIGGGGDSKTYLGVLGLATIKYNAVSTGNVNITTREAGINLGSFTVSSFGTGGTVTSDTPFIITVKMTAPFPALIKLRGVIKAGNITSNSVGNVKLVFDSPIYNLAGSLITLPLSVTPNAPNVNGGKTDFSITITLAQPRRLVIRSIGYGPRGARKVFEAIVKRDNFDGLLPATVTLVGSTLGSIFKSSIISSQQVNYSGSDPFSSAKIPPIGTMGNSGGGLLGGLISNLTGTFCVGCTVNGSPTEFSPEETPDFLKTAADLDKFVKDYRETAKSSGRYFTGGAAPDGYGNNAQGTGLTFIDGDGSLSGAGGGILIVTGKLTLNSAFDFNGVILVTGADGVKRTGGGVGNLQGNLVVAPYNIADTAGSFLPPKYDITGGTASQIIYAASNLLFGSNNYNAVLVSVGEKQ